MLTTGTIAAVLRVALMGACLSLTGCTSFGNGLAVLTSVDATAQTPDQGSFNPFNQKSDTAQAAREVIQNPTVAEIMEAGPLGEMSWGKADAPVTLVQYQSLTCRYCRRFHMETFPQLKKEFIDTGKVRYILREFPIGKSSGTATIALRCAPADKYLALYGKFMEQQGAWVAQDVRTDQILKVAAQVGVTGDQFSACLADKDMIAKLAQIKDRGRKLGIIGTPNYFLNGKLVKSEIGLGDIRLATMAAENRPMPRPGASVAKVN
jgi:protein-disulfide isomerase